MPVGNEDLSARKVGPKRSAKATFTTALGGIPLVTECARLTQNKTLSELVKEIETEANKGDEHLIATAMLVRELKNRIKAGEAGEGVKWTVWAKQNFHLSKSRLYELDIVGSSANPKATLAYYRQKNCERQKRLRERAIERDPERCAVVEFIRTTDIEHVRRIRKFIATLLGHERASKTDFNP
jgi:hypothetical protein